MKKDNMKKNSKYFRFKERVFDVIQSAEYGDVLSKVFDIFIITLIFANVVVIIAETFDISDAVRGYINVFETVSVIIFTVEYALRIWTADLMYPELSPVKSRVRYVFSFMAFIDLLAILPFYLPFFIPIDLRVLRMFRIVRLFRVFKINRYTSALHTIAEVFRRKASQLISSMLVVLLLMIIAAVLMYNIESTVQSELFSNALEAMWWAVSTLTTVGYGDVYPVTAVGKVLATVIAFLGIGLIAVPTGIISAGFAETVNEEQRKSAQAENEKDKKSFCPYCGHKLDE